MDTKLVTIDLAKDEMMMEKNIDAGLIISAGKIAEDDIYLYDLLVDYLSSHDNDIKQMLLEEVVNYTEEILRKNKRA